MLGILAVATGCAGNQISPIAGGGGSTDRPPVFKRTVAAINGNPTSVVARMNTAGVQLPGASALQQLAQAGMSETTAAGALQPVLAETLPSIENGLWKVLPDGRMETTWRIRDNARWHDGVPVTAPDLVFTTVVDRDPELAMVRDAGYQSVDRVQAADERTVVVLWSKPYIAADAMFGTGFSGVGFAMPLPRHLLEEAYVGNKVAFQGLPYWSQEFVGTGPFKVRDFVAGSHVSMVANPDYVFGRPKLDEIEVRFMLDLDTMVANLLAGTVELSLGRGFSVEQALDVQLQWQAGRVGVRPRSWIVIYPQFINPSPRVIEDVRFRRALTYATDRQQMMDTLQGGMTGVAHVFLNPSEPEYKDVEGSVVRYDYDRRRAAQLIEELGYTKGSDGPYRDPVGQALAIEIRNYGVKIGQRATLALADEWTRFGVSAEPVIIPPQRVQDREYIANFPGFLVFRQPNSAMDVGRLHGSQALTPETHFVGSNFARYQNRALDSLIEGFLTTVPRAERLDLLRQVVYHVSDQLNNIGLFYDAEITMVSTRLGPITAAEERLWSVHEWDVGPGGR